MILRADTLWMVSPSSDIDVRIDEDGVSVRFASSWGPRTEEPRPTDMLSVTFKRAAATLTGPMPEAGKCPSEAYGASFGVRDPGDDVEKRRRVLHAEWLRQSRAPDPGVYEILGEPWPVPVSTAGPAHRRFLVEGHDQYLEVLAKEAFWSFEGHEQRSELRFGEF